MKMNEIDDERRERRFAEIFKIISIYLVRG